jgi:hypothetical protein
VVCRHVFDKLECAAGEESLRNTALISCISEEWNGM